MTPRLTFVVSNPTTSLVANGLTQTYASILSKIIKVGLTLCLDLTYELDALMSCDSAHLVGLRLFSVGRETAKGRSPFSPDLV